jgi:hypothetical protein
MEQVPPSLQLDVLQLNPPRGPLLHVGGEHGSEDGGSAWAL